MAISSDAHDWSGGKINGITPRRATDSTFSPGGISEGIAVNYFEDAIGLDERLFGQYYGNIVANGINWGVANVERAWQDYDNAFDPVYSPHHVAGTAAGAHGSGHGVELAMAQAQLDTIMDGNRALWLAARRGVASTRALSTYQAKLDPANCKFGRTMIPAELFNVANTSRFERLDDSAMHATPLTLDESLNLRLDLNPKNAVILIVTGNAFQYTPRAIYYCICEMRSVFTPEMRDTTKSGRLARELEWRVPPGCGIDLSKVHAIVFRNHITDGQFRDIKDLESLLGGIEWREELYASGSGGVA